jgi:hypothetical protein
VIKWIAIATLVLMLSACKSVPENLNSGELIASAGVRAFFDDPNVDAVEAGSKISCKRERRVGTHMIFKVCMTKEEWKDRELATRDMHRRYRETNPCTANLSGAFGNTTANGKATFCGEGSVKGR